MVHRVQKVVPDLDDRLISPDSARNSLNMRFAASIGDTNLSMSLVNGMSEMEYPEENPLPVGDNQVIGVKEDFETQSVFFMLWNSNDNGGLYRIQGNTIALVLKVPGLVENSDVSIAIIDNKAYWTDNFSQPRMCSIAKGIANDYPTPLEEWMITQIKRPPAETLEKPNQTIKTLQQFSSDYNPLALNIQATGIQFSYYYIYDNEEESRLAPWSYPIWTALDLRIRADEFDTYVKENTIVKDVVFVYRIGNDGIVYSIFTVKREDFDSTGRPIDQDGNLIGFITNPWILPRIGLTSNITNAQFDSVPLRSISNEIAQNRITHGNYVLDYDTVTGLTLDCTAVQITHSEVNPLNSTQYQTFRPSGQYNFGIELLDLWGRPITVLQPKTVSIPASRYTCTGVNSPQLTPIVPSIYNDDYVYNSYEVDFEISGGTLPDWVKYIRLLSSKDQTVSYFHKSVCRLFYWYQDSQGNDIISITTKITPTFSNDWPPVNLLSEVGEKLNYTLKGYAIEVCSPMPFIYTQGEEQFVRIALEYWYNISPPVGTPQESDEYRISKSVGNLFYFETSNNNYSPSYYTGESILDDPITAYVPLWYSVEFLTKKTAQDALYYQNEQIFSIDEYVAGGNSITGTVQGDCYASVFKKRFAPVINKFAVVLDGSGIFLRNLSIKSYNGISHEIIGTFVSMNPTNIYAQSWDSDIGQVNTVNENQRQVRIQQGIIFSDSLIQGTQINGLSKFNSVDNRQAPLENGPITALVRTSATQREPGVLLAIGKNGVSSFYYDGIQLTNVDGTSNVSTSDKYLASQRPLVGNYGAEKLRNICATPLGTVYYWSEGIRDWIRYTNAGLEQLGETYQFMNYLRDQLDSSTSVMMTYDQVTDEAIIVGDDSNAYVFSERFKTFQGGRAYYDATNIRPERGATLSTRTFFFLEGHIWQMGPSVAATTENSFFGTLRNPELTIVSNEMPTVAKQWNSIKVLGNRPLTCQMNSGNSELPSVESHIDQDWWINRKGDWDAAIRRDENSVGGVMNGKIMESRILISTFAWDATDFDKLNYIEVKSNKSIVQ